MAGDTREPSPPATANPALGQSDLSGTSGSAQKKYATFEKGPTSANALPAGSGLNTAGSKLNNDYTLVDAIKTVRLEDFKQVHMYPCVRESLLTGIGAGFGVGGLRAIFGAPIPKAANWAVGSFMILSIANYEYCMYRRQIEKAGMKRAVQIMQEKKTKEKAMEESARIKREERRKAKEEADREEERKRKSSWKFW